nr:hypothetical protein [Pandoraea nosoerga]
MHALAQLNVARDSPVRGLDEKLKQAFAVGAVQACGFVTRHDRVDAARPVLERLDDDRRRGRKRQFDGGMIVDGVDPARIAADQLQRFDKSLS